ncbi:MAG: ketoacyl-ACP synthase III [Phycisphaerae bacterium]|jgi:3-oxoacyl-[acyl-carrier-protein] synthase-3|nr:ketoacyl-ACP synthase III [Phycisphaerae bacterium]HPC23376.1 beta-ketoacyl-ACP synthase III [Phycisphaerae bacterium]HRS27501.1 beta-ketoacyl-ACP synthase III [Phycisphaerae bacterium]
MKVDWEVEVAGTGFSVPERIVTNAEFASRIDTSDEWIVQRTGIRERRFAAPDESTLTFAAAAGRTALAQAQMSPTELDLIVCGTITPDHTLPSTASLLQAELGCRWIPAFDLAAACSGMVWSFIVAAQYIATGTARNVLVVGAETLTRITDQEDRGTAVLFGDGAGAVILRPSTAPQRRILAMRQGADGTRAMLINVPAGGAKYPASPQTLAERMHYMRMRGREIYKFAVTQMCDIIHETAADAGLRVEDVALIIPHQSNLRIIELACHKAGVAPERVLVNIDRYGNTSAASVGIALHEARMAGRIKPGDVVMLVAFGAGLTWGSILLRM